MGDSGQEPAAGWRSKPGWMRGTRGCRGGRNMKKKIFWSKFCLVFFLTVGVKKPNQQTNKSPKTPAAAELHSFRVEFMGKNILFLVR